MSSDQKKKRPRAMEEQEDEGEVVYEEENGESEEEDSLEGEYEESSDIDPGMEVNVEFEVRPISGDDGPAIQHLLQQLLLKGSADVFGLTQLLLVQYGIGSVIQVESDLRKDGEDGEEGREGEVESSSSCGDELVDGGDKEEVCGVTSVLNLTHHMTSKAVKSLIDHLLTKCKQHSPSLHSQLSQLLAPPTNETSGSHIGLLVNERFLNIPPHIAPPLLNTLLTQVKEASGKGLPYSFESYLLLARSYFIPSPLSPPQAKRRKRRGESESRECGNGVEETEGHLEEATSPSCPRYVLHHQEYELFQEEAELTFSYPVSGEDSGSDGGGDLVFSGGWSFEDDSLVQTRTVMVVPASRLQSAIDKLSSLLT